MIELYKLTRMLSMTATTVMNYDDGIIIINIRIFFH